MLENGGYSSTTLKTFQHIQRRRHVTGFSSRTKHFFTWFLPYRALNVSSDSRPDYFWTELPVSHSPTHTSNSFHLTHSLNIQRSPINSPSPHLFLLFYSRLAESSRAPSHLSCGRGREAEPMLDFCGFSLWSGWFIFLFPPQSSPHLADFLARPLKLHFCRFHSAALVWLMANSHRGTESLGALAQNEDGA